MEWQRALEDRIKVPVEVMSREDAERATVVICASPPSTIRDPRPDDVEARCAGGCGAMVRYRVHAPQCPPKMCARCGQIALGVGRG